MFRGPRSMTVSMGIKRLDGEGYEVVPIATSDYFATHWLPACAQLGLRLVARFHDGSLAAVTAEELREIVSELERLQVWARANDASAYMNERIDRLIRLLRGADVATSEYDFG